MLTTYGQTMFLITLEKVAANSHLPSTPDMYNLDNEVCFHPVTPPFSGVFTAYEYGSIDMPQFFYVSTNAQNPHYVQDAEFILFGENHFEKPHKSLQNYFIDILGEHGDYIFVENWHYQMDCPDKIAARFEPHYSNPDNQYKFICQGWQIESVYKEASEVVDERENNHKVFQIIFSNKSIIPKTVFKGIYGKAPTEYPKAIIREMQQLFQAGPISKALWRRINKNNQLEHALQQKLEDQKLEGSRKLVIGKLADILYSIMSPIMKKIYEEDNENFDKLVCSQRNKVLIDILKELQEGSPNKRKFIIGGMNHFFPKVLQNKPASIDEIAEDECPYELAEYLKTQSYAILMPK